MTDGPEWFAPKKYGYGAGLPISWQGWLVTSAFLALVFGVVFLLPPNPLLILSVITPAAVIMTLITAKTTKGGWRWRWGDQDKDLSPPTDPAAD
jgi:hypothetical protein